MSLEHRLIDLEIKVAHQDQLLEELNDVIYQQQKALDEMQIQMTALRNKLADSDSETRNEKPPHY